MEEKVRFVLEYEQDERSMTELCQGYGIARETGYVWLGRYREKGLAGLVELNRAALHHGNQTPAETKQRKYGKKIWGKYGDRRVECTLKLRQRKW
jgi:transposase-like protein